MPLAVNVSRLDLMMTDITPEEKKFYSSEVSFVGSMYNEKHNFYERMKDISAYTKGYLDGIMQAQMKVYGEYFIQQLLKPDILNNMKKRCRLNRENMGSKQKTGCLLTML